MFENKVYFSPHKQISSIHIHLPLFNTNHKMWCLHVWRMSQHISIFLLCTQPLMFF